MAITTNLASRGKCSWIDLRLISLVYEFVWKWFNCSVNILKGDVLSVDQIIEAHCHFNVYDTLQEIMHDVRWKTLTVKMV